jgi:murein DD-endopeptidase MepM/ murein hydrolase activator NlpD
MISLHIHWLRSGSQRSLRLHAPALFTLGSLGLGALAGSFALGASMPLQQAMSDRDAVRKELRVQRSVVDQTRVAAQTQMQGLIDRVAELQSRVQPLEAVSQRVSKAARLAPDAAPNTAPAFAEPRQAFAVVDFVAELDGLSRQIDRRAAQFSVLDRVIGAGIIERGPLLATPVRGAQLSSGFGARRDPFSGIRDFHTGIDFRAPPGAPVRAIAGGKVIGRTGDPGAQPDGMA